MHLSFFFTNTIFYYFTVSYATLNCSCKLHDTCFSWSFWCLGYREKSISLSWLTKKSDSDFFNSWVDLCLLICFCLICVRCWTTDLLHLTSLISSSGSLCIQTWALRHAGLFLFVCFLFKPSLHVLHQVFSSSNTLPYPHHPLLAPLDTLWGMEKCFENPVFKLYWTEHAIFLFP